MKFRLRLASVFLGFVFLGAFACSSPTSGRFGRSASNPDLSAETAVAKTEEDERMAPEIQRDLNAIFFGHKKENPGGVDAFSTDRVQALEIALSQSDRPAIRYYRSNREFFDRVEDSGGGFRVLSNAKRLVPYRQTSAGRRKLFAMDGARVKEMIANPCFSAIEDCGESASDGEENTVLLEEWVKKYPEKEYRVPREKVLRSYLAVLDKYRKRVARDVSPKAASKLGGTKEASLLVGTHIRGVQTLLEN